MIAYRQSRLTSQSSQYSRHLVIFCEPDGITQDTITNGIETVDCLVWQASGSIAERFQHYASQLFLELRQLLTHPQETKVLLQVVIRDLPEHQVFAGLAGLLLTARQENPNLVGQILKLSSNDSPGTIVAKLKNNAQLPLDQRIDYHNGKRRVAGWEEIQVSDGAISIPWKEKGTYLITGGLGGLGLLFTQEIIRQINGGTVILVGRSPLNPAKQKILKHIQDSCGKKHIALDYVQADVCNSKDTERLIETINHKFGDLNGIIHAAGVIHDNFILKKTVQDLEKVLAPKVIGLVNLDEATKEQPLDFFFFCSSLAGSIGNVGQADYACANAFMDCYARYRNHLLPLQQRQGRALSINWPLWRDGGMQVDAVHEQMMAQSIGLFAMPTSAGMKALYKAFASNQDQVMVLEGNLAQLKQAFLQTPHPPQPPIGNGGSPSGPPPCQGGVKGGDSSQEGTKEDNLDPKKLQQKTLEKLKTLFAEMTKLPLDRVDVDEPLDSYGIDSILITQLNQKLTEGLGSVSKTLFYEFQTLAELAHHLAIAYGDACFKWTHVEQTHVEQTHLDSAIAPPSSHQMTGSDIAADALPVFDQPAIKTDDVPKKLTNGHAVVQQESLDGHFRTQNNSTQQPIAIIGLSGRYPQAKTVTEFWQNLINAEHCISEIPRNRWDWKRHYHADPNEAVKLGKSYTKWGGFLDDFDQFDPLFFNITPREAENIDPQERLFLQECWSALEDAGYSPSNLSADLRQRVGVFAGITKQGFNLYRTDLGKREHNGKRYPEFPATSFASLVNRVSYHLNLQGPSFPVDTMCSSSLVAIHEACEYIRSGKGDMAVVGGVNIYAHPSTYLELSIGRFISSSSICAAFEKDGEGFVPGEGVGAVILKAYDQAVQDRDSIYALIRGSAVNHDGRTNGYKTPNPGPKAMVIRQSLQNSGVEARSISYIEAAAQGSDVGDAVEAKALTEVFGDRHNVEGSYRIGSVKPNIGHGEAVSGMAQLTKVILSLTHRTLVPTLRSRELSPSIDFEQLPFELQQDLDEWKPIQVDGVDIPRRAGVVSIGAGGTNASLILEEYVEEYAEEYAKNSQRHTNPTSKSAPGHKQQVPILFVLSAKNKTCLEQYVRDWLHYLKHSLETGQSLDLASMAYTLQMGRESMSCRLGFVIQQVVELIDYLTHWLNNHELGERGVYGDTTRSKLKNPEAVTALVNTGDSNNAWELATLWAQGNAIPWDQWHGGQKLIRLNGLPTYPFTSRRFWISQSDPGHLIDTSQVDANKHEPQVDANKSESQVDVNKAVEFYTQLSEDCDNVFQEEYLTFGAFPQRVPGFSMTRIALNGEQYPGEIEMVRKSQRELRQVLFYRENFDQVHTFLDIGCGHGTDVIQIAALYPHIQTHGFTITQSQAVLGNQRIKSMNLESHARIHHKDSSKDKFPDNCDIVLGIEVTFHIRDKDALFQKMADALSENGKILLMDYISNLRGSIVDPNVEISIPTQQQWIDLLSKHDLIIDEIIDVSTEVSNFLYDPEHAENTKHLPKVSQDTFRNYANQAVSLEKGWITYCLLKLKRDTHRSEQERREHNAQLISHQTPYVHALEEMLRLGHIPYPLTGGLKMAQESVSNPVEPPLDLPQLRYALSTIFASTLRFAAEDLQAIERLPFNDLGINSMNAVELLEAINTAFDLHLPTSLVFECPCLEDLAEHIQVELAQKPTVPEMPQLSVAQGNRQLSAPTTPPPQSTSNDDIAIIGLSCRCAGAKNQAQFWQVISQGKDCIEEVSNPEWLDYLATHSPEDFTIRYGILPDLDYFDPLFFRISPKEAKAMDATQRVLLEECYRAIEDAGYNPSGLKQQAVGTYIGAMGGTALGKGFSHLDMLGAETSVLAARMAYFLDLKGPALAINTACSSSLVAIEVASQALKNGEINLAIAGGVTLYQHPGTFISMHNAGMLSPTGQCRPFDNNADGIVVGDGVGVVILKRLQDAKRDRDSIYGIIRGCGTNQDGQTSSLTVPSFLSQSELETSVYKKANIQVEDLQYIEAHGTSTKLGDPIEIHALSKSFQSFTSKSQFCAIGSLKANVGHTTAAAGVLSVIKVLLGMKHQQLPPSIHFEAGNKHIDFDNSPVYVNTRLKAWPQNAQGSRLAAVSSFGFSGTNAHLVLEQYSSSPDEPINDNGSDGNHKKLTPRVFLLSAESEPELQHYANRVKVYLEENPDVSFEHFLYTFHVGRAAFTYRLAFVVDDHQSLIQQLAQWLGEGAKARGQGESAIASTKEEQAFIQSLIVGRKVEKLAQLWQQGTSIDWMAFYQPGDYHRLAGLPTYPFAREYFGADQDRPTQDGEIQHSQIQDYSPKSRSSAGTLICYPYWQEKSAVATSNPSAYAKHLVFLCGVSHISAADIEALMPGVECIDLCASDPLAASDGEPLVTLYRESFTYVFETIQTILANRVRGKIFIQCIVPQQTQLQCFSALAGMLKTVQQENPKVLGQILEVSANETQNAVLKMLKENSACPDDKQIRYCQEQRTVLGWQELTVSEQACKTPWREDGVYLVTGGTGGLGLIFAEEIAKNTQRSTLILSGRSPLNADQKTAFFNRLENLGATVDYQQADISRKNDVDRLMQYITTRYGSLNGILHCAGITRDNFLIKKTSAEFQSVLAPKVAGVVYLDAASKAINLDVFVLFSSLSGAVGNAGQADYATANAFMDAFASHRNALANSGQRYGQTLSINWPFWQAGGMKLEAHREAAMLQSVGLGTMETAQGIDALVKGLASGQSQILVASGNVPQLRQWLCPDSLFVSPPSDLSTAEPQTDNAQLHQYSSHLSSEKSLTELTSTDKQRLQEKTLMQLKSLLGEAFDLSPDRIKSHDTFERYGIDSVIITQLNQTLETIFPEISKTLFFEYQTSDALVAYLIEEYLQECLTWTGLDAETNAPTADLLPDRPEPSGDRLQVTMERPAPTIGISQGQEAIAIIGVSARFAQADTLQAYWDNLKAGKSCVGEIPANRWSLDNFFVEDMDRAIAQRKSYCKWGSFLDGFAEFDPLFFGIPPRDVLSMDPQERLFLQTAWEALEDAGYTRDTLREIYQQQVGVFAGITKTGFDLYGPELWKRGQQAMPHTSFSSVANRTSYFLNLKGPSMPIDTMCSSALTAIHEACEHLRRRDCQLALAGGVNLYLHPSSYVQMCAMRMLSPDGQCKAFGQGGNGFVPGEGVGIVLLKPLSEAIQARDNIYAVIRASAVNHGGKTHGYTVPNPVAQAELIHQTLQKGDIDARSISYVEAHGTGTKLGDPIEITGLTQAFKRETADTGFCAIGSAKSNVGHLEAASGMAGLCKILLQLKHRQLAPSLYTEALNPNIDFNKTPFVVQQTLTPWEKPVVTVNGKTQEYPRRAGLSSFGAGGSNAHLIIEESPQQVFKNVHNSPSQGAIKEDIDKPVAIVLSAKNAEQLMQMAQNLCSFLITEDASQSLQLADMAYTLQIGREAMEERLALIVNSRESLEQKLTAFVEGQDNIAALYRGRDRGREQPDSDLLSDVATTAEFASIIDSWIASHQLDRLLKLWVKGLVIDWQKLYIQPQHQHQPQHQPQRISLPTYPFAKDNYWFDSCFEPTELNQTDPDHLHLLGTEPKIGATVDNAVPHKICYLQKQWLLTPSQPDDVYSQNNGHPQSATARKIAILSTQETRLLAEVLAEELPSSHIIELEDIKTFLGQGNTDWQAYGSCIDLVGCGQGEAHNSSLDWIEWLQQLVKNTAQTDLTLLGVTRGLESFQNSAINLCGASRAGLYRMLASEYSHVQSRHVDMDPTLKTAALAAQIAHEFFLNDENCEICYRDHKRYCAHLAESALNPTKRSIADLQFSPEDVLLITGGTGGLGLLCAQHFVHHYGVKRLVLTGRTPLPPREQWDASHRVHDDRVLQKIQAIQSLESQGIEVQVLALDLSNKAEVQTSLGQITETLGAIAGLIHCAGIVDSDTPAFVRKSIPAIAQVLEPKITGLQSVLDTLAIGQQRALQQQPLQQQPLKFTVLFSSVSGIIPSLASGQSDYALANAYMDYAAEAIATNIATDIDTNIATDDVVSIQWPSWQETGMGAANSRAYQETGLLHHSNQQGLELLDHILTHKIGPVVLPAWVNSAHWNPQRLMQHHRQQASQSPPSSTSLSSKPSLNTPSSSLNHQGAAIATTSSQGSVSHRMTLKDLVNLFAQELGMPAQKLDLNKSFADYGLDSIWLAQLASKLNQQLAERLDPSILYEYSSLHSLASWLASEQAPTLKANADHNPNPQNPVEPNPIDRPHHTSAQTVANQQVSTQQQTSFIPAHQSNTSGTSAHESSHASRALDIAVVGMSCRFPGANNIDEYWSLLSSGKNSIRPVPAERWSKETPFYAGLMDNINYFDPDFFLIPPEDAKIMDPQALLVLEESLNLFCHAGYALDEIKGRAIGVYLGARSQHRVNASDLYQARNPIVGAQNYLATHISQFFDLQGPSLVIDTACSSALVGMNFAVQSLLSGEIDAAVVGGVSLLADEVAHQMFEQRNLLNQDAEFHIFDQRASGITLAEGVGLVLLKTVQQAQRDGDQIYAVIKGLAINNDGRTPGPATPNIKALKDVMQRALGQSAIQPKDIAHIEANGSGSEVTDLLELKAIEAIYRNDNQAPCSLGSIKPNIGHPLCAEGIAGFIKLVCMLKHQQRVPFLSGQTPLMHYDLNTSPFYFCRQSDAWTESPLIALNCFADGGTNAHVILAQWPQAAVDPQRQPIIPPTLKRTNVYGNMLSQAIANEKIANGDVANGKIARQRMENLSLNPWWG
ncbi:MAG: SDR family NAD(P)-dependent oxidoreductase [Cyanobacteria bacterium P01_F01_bin.150]